MNGIRKTLTRTMCAVILLITAVLQILPARAASTNGSTEVKAPKKIVSIVFDDSSSMYSGGEKSWAQANYATQVFAALMNPQDELRITYMSELTSGRIDLSDPVKAVKAIRKKKTNWSATPLEAVDVAAEALEKIQESDADTQFWLVIMTDGWFMNEDSEFSDIQDACDRLKGKTMSNGSKLHVYYYGIGESAMEVKPDSENGLEAVTSSDIVGTLNDVANTISGRLKYDNSEIKYIDNHTVEVSSAIPLYSISAFTQNTAAELKEAKVESAEGSTLKLDFQNIQVRSPKPEDVIGEYSDFDLISPVDIYGNVSNITNKDQVIPSGKYTITFSEPIDKGSLVLMYQPSIKLVLTMYKDGNEVRKASEVAEGDDIELRLTLIDPLSGDELDLGLLPSSTRSEIVEDGDHGQSTTSGIKTTVQDITPGSFSFVGQLTIPGMIPVHSNIIHLNVEEYSPTPAIHLTITKKGNLHDEVVYDNVDEIDMLDILEADDRITVKAEAYDTRTGGSIDSAKLHSSENWVITYLINAAVEDTRETNEYRDIDVQVGDNRIVCDYEIGGLTAQETIAFTIEYPAFYSIEVEKDTGIFPRNKLRDNPTKAPILWVTREEDLDKDGVGDGNPKRLSQKETAGAKQLILDNVKVERDDFGLIFNRIGFLKADVELSQSTDGSYVVYPTLNGLGGMLKKRLFPYLITTGHYRVNIVLDINKQEQEINIDVTGKITDWIPLILEILIMWLFWRIFYMIALKKKFARNGSLNLSVYQQSGRKGFELQGQNEEINLKRYGEHPFSKKPATVRVLTLGITVEATENGIPCIDTYSAFTDGYWGTSVSDPERKLISIKKEIVDKTEKRKKNESGESKKTRLRGQVVYFIESKESKQMYALTEKPRES